MSPQNSRYQTYQRMWNYMQSKQPSVFVKSTEEGVARVLSSRYAFLLESTMNEYHRRRNCNLTQVGGLLDTKGYGIGMPLGRPRGLGAGLSLLGASVWLGGVGLGWSRVCLGWRKGAGFGLIEGAISAGGWGLVGCSRCGWEGRG